MGPGSGVQESDAGFLDDAEDEGDDVDDEAVDAGDHSHLHSAPDDVAGDIGVLAEDVGRLHEAQKAPQKAESQGDQADFLDPAWGFPGSEEQCDKEKREDAHEAQSSFAEQNENIRS